MKTFRGSYVVGLLAALFAFAAIFPLIQSMAGRVSAAGGLAA
jgi:hypothetical protein